MQQKVAWRVVLFANNRPIDPDDPLVCEVFERLGKRQIPRSFPLFEAYDSKVCSTRALLYCHHPITLQLRLKTPVCGRFLPKDVNIGLAAFLNYLRKARSLCHKEFHNWPVNRAPDAAWATRAKSPPENYGKKDQTTVAAFLPWRDS